MVKNVEIGKCYTNGRQTVKVVYKNAGMAGYDCYLWVKTKKNWTAKTGYFDIQNDNWKEIEQSSFVQ
jgi:hypothetical protein